MVTTVRLPAGPRRHVAQRLGQAALTSAAELPDVMVRVDPDHVPPAMACGVERGGYTRSFGSESVLSGYRRALPNGVA